MRRLLLPFIAFLLIAQKDPVSRSWNQPVEPFRIVGNLYYVGASDIASYLIATTDGLIVIDGGFEETAPMILANIEKLGFKPKNVRLLLSTHAHYDHAGGFAALQRATGAPLFASRGDAPMLARGGLDDPQFGNAYAFPPIEAKRIFDDGYVVNLGGTKLVAHVTPGHTRGCTTWTTRLREGGRSYDVVIVGSASVPPQYRLTSNAAYPNAVADYELTFRTLRSLHCDIFLASHGNFFDLTDKVKRMRNGEKDVFIDPAGYMAYVDASEKRFRDLVK